MKREKTHQVLWKGNWRFLNHNKIVISWKKTKNKIRHHGWGDKSHKVKTKKEKLTSRHGWNLNLKKKLRRKKIIRQVEFLLLFLIRKKKEVPLLKSNHNGRRGGEKIFWFAYNIQKNLFVFLDSAGQML